MNRSRSFVLLALLIVLLITAVTGCITIRVPSSDSSPQDTSPSVMPQNEPVQDNLQMFVSSFVANPSSIIAGNSAKLTWNVSGAASVTIDHGIGIVPPIGEIIVSLPSTTVYKLTASNAAGSIVATTQLFVSPAPAVLPPAQIVSLPVINFFTAEPENITTGESGNLSWSVTNASSVTITPAIYRQLGSIPASGSVPVSPSVTTTYTLTATNIAGTRSETVTITVAAAPVVFQNWSGTWNTNWGEMIVTQSGDQISGTYTWDNGKIEGTITGNVFSGTWSEAPSYAPPDDAGDMELTISADFNSLTGKWRYGSSGEWDGSWEGSRIVPKTLFTH